MEQKEITREYIIRTLKELDAKSDKTVGKSALAQKGINQYHIKKFIPEGLTQLKKDLNLKISRQECPLSDVELLEQLDKIVSKLKHIPTWTEIWRATGITDKVFVNRFRKEGITGVFSHYAKWLDQNKSDSENIRLVKEYIEKQGKKTTSPVEIVPKKVDNKGTGYGKLIHGKPVYGSRINFRGLQHAPINELGVIFLFGMVSDELGFAVEAVQDGFPDCKAKRCVDRHKDRWQDVRIEFEYKSSNFIAHGHNPNKCDLIVCWEHNWRTDCPIEVIELKTKIKELPQSATK